MTKKESIQNLINDNGVISALAIDQRGALKQMMSEYMALGSAENEGELSHNIIWFKKLISKELTPYASAILLDPEYGLQAANDRDKNSGLLLAYEKTGYDVSKPGRLPDSLDEWSVKRIKEAGSDAVKFLLYYDIDENDFTNDQKKSYIERIGSECVAEDIPFFLELVSYDSKIRDSNSKEYAKIKPHKVIEMMKEFSKARYNVDVLKVEVPLNMSYVEGYSEGESVYSKEQAEKYFKEQSKATDLPFVFLSAGVSNELFKATLLFAKDSGSKFNGVLCGRAIWSGAVQVYIKEGYDKASEWCRTTGRNNIESLNEIILRTASSISNF